MDFLRLISAGKSPKMTWVRPSGSPLISDWPRNLFAQEAGRTVLAVKCTCRWYNGYFHRGTVGSEGDANYYFHSLTAFPFRSAFVRWAVRI